MDSAALKILNDKHRELLDLRKQSLALKILRMSDPDVTFVAECGGEEEACRLSDFGLTPSEIHTLCEPIVLAIEKKLQEKESAFEGSV